MRRLLLILGFLLAVGCEKPTAPPAVRKIGVVATVYPLADIARQVAGDVADVSWVIESGQSMKGVQPDEQLRNRLRSADLVLMGDVTEAWATEGSGAGQHYSRILRLETLPIARESGTSGLLWLDPAVAREAAKDLATRLAALRPQKVQEVRERADKLANEIDALYKPYQEKLRSADNRRFLVLGNDFAPFLSRFSFQAIPTLDAPPSRLTDEDIRLIQYVSRQNDTKLLVIPADTPAALVDDLRVRTGMQLVLLDALGTSAGGGRNTYLDLIRWNLDQLAKATMVH